MGYSKSKKTLEKIRPQLAQLELGLNASWRTQEGGADFFAYKVREALFIAKLYREEYLELAKMADTTRVVVVSPSLVETKAAVGTPEAVIQSGNAAVVVQGLAEGGREPSTTSPHTAAAVIAEWQRRQPSNDKLHFPQANLPREELLKLHTWASNLTPSWLFFEFDGAITLQPYSRDVAELSWSPEDL